MPALMSADHCRVKTLSVLAGTGLLLNLRMGAVCRLAAARERAASSDIGVSQNFGQRGDAHRGLDKSCMAQCIDTLFFSLRCQFRATGILQNQILHSRCDRHDLKQTNPAPVALVTLGATFCRIKMVLV